MQKSEKEELIKELNEKFARAKTAIVAEFTKLDVETVTKLRKKFREGKVEYKVLKNTLAKRAAKGTPWRSSPRTSRARWRWPSATTTWWPRRRSSRTFIKDLETIKIRSARRRGQAGRREGREGAGEDAGPAGAPREAARDDHPACGQAGPHHRSTPVSSWPGCSRPTSTRPSQVAVSRSSTTRNLSAFYSRCKQRPLEGRRLTMADLNHDR